MYLAQLGYQAQCAYNQNKVELLRHTIILRYITSYRSLWCQMSVIRIKIFSILSVRYERRVFLEISGKVVIGIYTGFCYLLDVP